MKNLLTLSLMALLALAYASCQREPPLHLHRGNHIEMMFPTVELDLKVYWTYELDYDWEAEWTYGWDEVDEELFGSIGYHEPSVFDIRRYYLHDQPGARHTMVESFEVNGKIFRTEYQIGYYDFLVWNKVFTPDGVQSLIIDEETTLDSVMAFTNMGMARVRYQEPPTPEPSTSPRSSSQATARTSTCRATSRTTTITTPRRTSITRKSTWSSTPSPISTSPKCDCTTTADASTASTARQTSAAWQGR